MRVYHNENKTLNILIKESKHCGDKVIILQVEKLNDIEKVGLFGQISDVTQVMETSVLHFTISVTDPPTVPVKSGDFTDSGWM